MYLPTRGALLTRGVLLSLIALFSAAPSQVQAEEATQPEAQVEADAEAEADRLGRAAFERGRVAFDAGDYETSLSAFSEAYELTGRPALQYNVGLSQDRLRMDQEALDSFESYLAAVPDSPYLEQVTGRITALRQAVARRHSERERLEAERAEAEAAAAAAEARPSRWWIGVLIGVVVVGAGVGLAVGLTRDGDAFAPSDFGATTYTLGSF
ncbi:MAG: hypothetical protein AB8H86_20255 [Polyangiales bacterium]